MPTAHSRLDANGAIRRVRGSASLRQPVTHHPAADTSRSRLPLPPAPRTSGDASLRCTGIHRDSSRCGPTAASRSPRLIAPRRGSDAAARAWIVALHRSTRQHLVGRRNPEQRRFAPAAHRLDRTDASGAAPSSTARRRRKPQMRVSRETAARRQLDHAARTESAPHYTPDVPGTLPIDTGTR